MLNVAAKLRKVEEKARLALTALNKSIRVQQLLNDARLTSSLVGLLPIMLAIRDVVPIIVVATRRIGLIRVVAEQSIHQVHGRRVEVHVTPTVRHAALAIAIPEDGVVASIIVAIATPRARRVQRLDGERSNWERIVIIVVIHIIVRVVGDETRGLRRLRVLVLIVPEEDVTSIKFAQIEKGSWKEIIFYYIFCRPKLP